MSTSPSRSLAAEAPKSSPPTGFQPFPYDVIPPNSSPLGTSEIFVGATMQPTRTASQESAARDAQARAQGREEGRAEARKIFEEQLARERAALADTLAQFTRDRAVYFQKVESEVVQLALSIARKILHREAQLDPLLLAGIVRVTLETIDGATGVVLRVHPQEGAEWRRFLSTHLEPADLPEIIDDPAMPLDRCTLETAMGTATVGLEVQLKEIEQGLMDLLAARPGAGS